MIRRQRKPRAGFTLIEVLLVLAILVILGGMVGIYFSRIQGNAYSDAAKTQMGMFSQNLKIYRLDTGGYPTTEQGLNALVEQPSGLTKWRGPYLEGAIPVDPWGQPYQYKLEGGDQYLIWSFGPDRADGTEDDVKTGTGPQQ